MKKLFYLSALLFFCTSTLFAQKNQILNNQNKVIREKFSIQSKDIIELNTNYVKNITIEESDSNEVVFITTITLNKSSKENFDNLMKAIKISNKQSGKTITYTFDIDWSGRSKTNNLTGITDITLKIFAPKDVLYDITARYGNVKVENVYNDFRANIAYGNLDAHDLLGNNNKIEIKYGNLTMEDFRGSRNQVVIKYGKFKIFKAEHLGLDIKYSQGDIINAGMLRLDSKYCTVTLNTVKNLIFTSGYDKITIQKSIEKIEGDMKYGTLTLKSLKSSCVLNPFSYSKITIEEVLNSFTNIFITDATHSNIFLNIPREESFAFDYSGRYTDFKDKNIRLNEATFSSDNYTTGMQGIYGKKLASDKKVKISARYGSVSLFER
ncbi:MAG: hypothetical protein LBI45_05270 [Bacteroidales bacterium]|jgi:hypothetical protein|nr:hypothetical protein [Bacteroidales bacterium]